MKFLPAFFRTATVRRFSGDRFVISLKSCPVIQRRLGVVGRYVLIPIISLHLYTLSASPRIDADRHGQILHSLLFTHP